MMETKDLQQLHDLLIAWRNMLRERSDAWAYCATVLMDVNTELLKRRQKEAATTR